MKRSLFRNSWFGRKAVDRRGWGLLAAIAIVAFPFNATQASSLTPGGTVGPPAAAEFNPSSGATVLYSTNAPFSSAVFSGLLTTMVLTNDASNPFGGLTFVYQIAVGAGSTHAVSQLSISSYGAFLTDVSYTNPPASSDISPAFMSRSSEGGSIGDVVRFNFGIFGPPPLSAGDTSALLVVQTDSLNWQFTTASVADGVAAPGIASLAPVSAPVVPVPEPDSLVISLAGLMGLMLNRRPKKMRK
jgi:hypothetical protein